MGAGSFLTGQGLAGADPITPGTSTLDRTPPTAAWFDPSTGLIDPTKQLHPVDHKVAIACGIERGSLPSSPLIGSRLRWWLGNAGPTPTLRQTAAEAGVREMFGALLAAGDISLISVTVDSPARDVVTTVYVNNRIGSNANRTVRTKTMS